MSTDDVPEWTLRGEYDDDRSIEIMPSINGEVAITVGNQEPVFVFAEDLLRVATMAGLDALATLKPTPRERERLGLT